MEAIAEAAGVAKGTVYLYYPSKQAIHDATFAAGMADIERLIQEHVERATTAREARPSPSGAYSSGSGRRGGTR